MTDLDDIRRADLREPLPSTKTPSILPWALIAAILILISVAIHFLWPLPTTPKRLSYGLSQSSAVERVC